MLTAAEIQRRLQNAGRDGGAAPPGTRGRRAAVLVPFTLVDGEWNLLYIRRTNQVAEHKGQVAFPGGAMDPEDATLEDTALREAWEEVGLEPGSVQIFGRLPELYTITNYLITPVAALIPWPFDLRISALEVERVFLMPLDWLANPVNREVRDYTRAGSERAEKVIFFRPYDGELLWGATAHITVELLRILNFVD